ncbi:MAG: ABC transporter permease [Firmicutes bacterium]|nr:ABC transporter permease [Bacillota bacterium]
MRTVYVFAVRNGKEILRDPLSYLFALGFPVVMLGIMTLVNSSLPKEAALNIFQMENLAPGVSLFGFTFVMLFTAMLVAKDRSTAFLMRLYAAPVSSGRFLAGYVAPMVVLGIGQYIITYLTAQGILWMEEGKLLSFSGICLSLLASIPALLLFIGLGLLFGSLLSDKAAPGVASILITVATILGGVWMDIETVGGSLLQVAKILPFFPATSLARTTLSVGYGHMEQNFMVIGLWIVAVFFLAVWRFSWNRSRDLK